MTVEVLDLTAGQLEADRYHRQTLIPWWEQSVIAGARVLVVGAGALGNEILKLLALTGVGRVLVYDPDRIERSNLSRSVLFRDGDESGNKAEVAVARMRELNPEVRVEARPHNVIGRAGLGVFAWADIVIGAVDNREARVFINSACARTGKRWVDGGIESLSGVVRAFDPARDSCYECTMSAVDRRMLDQRRSCALLARDVVAAGHVPTTAVAASIIGGLQVQEAVKLLHGQPALLGEGVHIDGLAGEFSRVRYPRREDCMGHDQLDPAIELSASSAELTVGELLARAERELGPDAQIDLSRDFAVGWSCPECGASARCGAALGTLREADARCPGCGAHRLADFASSLVRGGTIDEQRTLAELGLPLLDIVVARAGERQVTWLIGGDRAAALGGLQ